MNTKSKYISPQIEVIEVEMESATAVMTHSADMTNAETIGNGGRFDSKQRTFWDD